MCSDSSTRRASENTDDTSDPPRNAVLPAEDHDRKHEGAERADAHDPESGGTLLQQVPQVFVLTNSLLSILQVQMPVMTDRYPIALRVKFAFRVRVAST
jgi:hypothetical protein